jgi:hypothetical protein
MIAYRAILTIYFKMLKIANFEIEIDDGTLESVNLYY